MPGSDRLRYAGLPRPAIMRPAGRIQNGVGKLLETVMDKYQALREAGTNGANYDLDTDAVIGHLREWDAKYGIELSDASSDSVVVLFDRLPDDAGSLADDVYAFCPDTVDQHFGCFKEMLEMHEDAVPEDLRELVEGVDLEDENYGVELLRKSIVSTKAVRLWWD
ncbi:DUF4253 domain-containing protein [Isosphaeraceae bacterium EP7]